MYVCQCMSMYVNVYHHERKIHSECGNSEWNSMEVCPPLHRPHSSAIARSVARPRGGPAPPLALRATAAAPSGNASSDTWRSIGTTGTGIRTTQPDTIDEAIHTYLYIYYIIIYIYIYRQYLSVHISLMYILGLLTIL